MVILYHNTHNIVHNESSSLVHLLGGTTGVGGARSARIISSDGTPLEVFIGGGNASDGGDTGGLFGALGGMFNSPFASNPGDYAFGNLSNIINQLMQNDPNRVRSQNVSGLWSRCIIVSNFCSQYFCGSMALLRPQRTSWRHCRSSRSRRATWTRAPSAPCARTSLSWTTSPTNCPARTRSISIAYCRGSSR